MIDVILLRVLKNRKEYASLSPMIPYDKTLSEETRALVADYGKYFMAYPSHDKIDWPTFVPQFQRWHSGLKEDRLKQFVMIFKEAMKDADADQRGQLINDLSEIGLATKLANAVSEFEEGEQPDLFGAISAATDEYRRRIGFKSISFIDTPIGDLINEEFDSSGLQWRLKCLRDSMRGLRWGDFGIFAGRPDKGKTSFVASEITCLGAQLHPDRNVLWLNNEGPGRRIIPRLYQAALDFDMTDMKVHHQAGKLEDEYRKVMGRLDRIRVIDIHGLTNTQVEILIEEHNAGLVVFDMIDNIRGFGDAARTDLALEQMYQWGREKMVQYECIGIATSQISADGDGLMHPTMPMLKDSKTGKQGACDFQVMIGASNDAMYNASRWINVVKNKLRHPTGESDPRAEVIFDPTKSRFRDMPIAIAGT